jgi:cytoskeletal protein CcmA (bactofilin family)
MGLLKGNGSVMKTESGGSDMGVIGRGIEVSGDIFFAEQLHVFGKIEGKVSSDSGTLIIGESGRLEAQVDVGICVIQGALHGNLIAKTRVEIHRTGRVNGDLITPVLLVEEGGVFNGAIKMGQDVVSRKLEEVPPVKNAAPPRQVKGA